jgi:hypothetical protein
VRWKRREAFALRNGVMEAVVLAGGGHLAVLRLVDAQSPTCNALWEAPWRTADPDTTPFTALGAQYGGPPTGEFLAGFTGHALCLDTFGLPSHDDEAHGAALHGEAATRQWKITPTAGGCTMTIDLPRANLRFSRTLSLAENQSVLFIEERLLNCGSASRAVHWVNHVTLGPPLLEPGHSAVQASVDACRTWPLGYEGRAILPDNADFAWPHAPTLAGRAVDLRLPFEHPGKGFVVAARVCPAEPFAFIAACNAKLGLMLLYCFRREDFAWIALWEENRARPDTPWNGTTQARGMEFGTTPMPLGREAIHAMGPLFDVPVERMLTAGGSHAARYAVCLAALSVDARTIEHVTVADEAFIVKLAGGGRKITLPTAGVKRFLLQKDDQTRELAPCPTIESG